MTDIRDIFPIRTASVKSDPHPDCYGIDRGIYDCFCGVLSRGQRVDCLRAWMRQQEAARAIDEFRRLPWWRRWWGALKP